MLPLWRSIAFIIEISCISMLSSWKCVPFLCCQSTILLTVHFTAEICRLCNHNGALCCHYVGPFLRCDIGDLVFVLPFGDLSFVLSLKRSDLWADTLEGGYSCCRCVYCICTERCCF
jgi:hypothetical protein